MVQRNDAINDGAQQFDTLLGSLIERYLDEGDLYYHEIIGILHMHSAKLALDSYGIFDEDDEEEEEDENWGIGGSLM